MEKTYNKLVRDRIPEIIIGNGGKPIVKTLNDEEYKKELEKKLFEECNEVLCTTTKEERIEELADMFEIIKSLSLLEGSSIDEVIEVAKSKEIKRGGFKEKIYLKKVIEE